MRICIRVLACLALALAGTPAAADTLKLDNGDTISGEIVEERDDAVVLEHPILGRVEVPRERLFTEPPPNPGLFGTGFMEGWTRTLSLGLSGSEGNTVNANVTGGIDLKAENEKRRWNWSGRYFVKTEDRSTSDHNARAETRYDWILPESRWFVFLHPVYDFDQFKDWKHRATLSGGPGYDILKSEPLDLRSSLGLSAQREFFGEKDTRISAVWAVNAEIRIADSHSLTLSNQIFPSLLTISPTWRTEGPGEFRNLSRLAWRIRLAEDPGLNLDLGVENEYESYAPPEDKKNDLKYFGTLGLEF